MLSLHIINRIALWKPYSPAEMLFYAGLWGAFHGIKRAEIRHLG